jgi:ubiquinone/menaquinone biosynthesis C-methylase UbiE
LRFSDFFSRQAEKPSGLFGRWIMARIFDRGNADLNAFMLERLAPQASDEILEIGFGTGMLIRQMAAATPQGIIEGVDFSDTMVAMAARRNRKAIADGRVKLHQGSFEDAPLGAGRFDAVCSANTIYFWSDPATTARKIHTVLKPDGRLVLGFGDREQLQAKPLSADVFRLYSNDEVRQLLFAAGFASVEILTRKARQYRLSCAVASK